MQCRPFGTVIASEIFSSGVLLSEYVHGYLSWPFLPDFHNVVSTDFRQFEQYLNVSGIDVRYFLVSRVIPILPI
jgi:hypothetical protein